MANTQKKYTAAQQLALFNDNTSMYKSPVQTQSGTENGTLKFTFDNSKLLHKTYVLITATLTSVHASSSTYTPHEDGVFNFINKISLISHKGFRPFDISGKALKLLNYANLGDVAMTSSTSDGRYRQVQGVTSSSGSGTANQIRILAELPNTINDRDLAGLILLQNDKVNLSLEITLGSVSDLAPASSGYTFSLTSISSSQVQHINTKFHHTC